MAPLTCSLYPFSNIYTYMRTYCLLFVVITVACTESLWRHKRGGIRKTKTESYEKCWRRDNQQKNAKLENFTLSLYTCCCREAMKKKMFSRKNESAWSELGEVKQQRRKLNVKISTANEKRKLKKQKITKGKTFWKK